MLEDPSEYPRSVLEDSAHQGCATACYRCLLRYGNQPFHGLLDWQLGMLFLRAMTDPVFRCGLDALAAQRPPSPGPETPDGWEPVVGARWRDGHRWEGSS
jgi:hypothetical protein